MARVVARHIGVPRYALEDAHRHVFREGRHHIVAEAGESQGWATPYYRGWYTDDGRRWEVRFGDVTLPLCSLKQITAARAAEVSWEARLCGE